MEIVKIAAWAVLCVLAISAFWQWRRLSGPEKQHDPRGREASLVLYVALLGLGTLVAYVAFRMTFADDFLVVFTVLGFIGGLVFTLVLWLIARRGSAGARLGMVAPLIVMIGSMAWWAQLQ